VSPEETRQLADEIVSRPEFHIPEPTVQQRATEGAERYLGDLLNSVFSGGGGTIVGFVVLAALIGLIVWLVLRVGRTVQVDARVPGMTIDEVHRKAPTAWREEAERLEAEGRWKEGIRARYRALVGDLVADDLLDDVAGRTTGELRAHLRASAPDRSEAFGAATELFELAWYADRPTGPEQSARFRALAAEVSGVRA
jgi:hypothetical protein